MTSVGVADSEKDADAVPRLADQAMYQAKRAGKNQVAVCRSNGDSAANIASGDTDGDGPYKRDDADTSVTTQK